MRGFLKNNSVVKSWRDFTGLSSFASRGCGPWWLSNFGVKYAKELPPINVARTAPPFLRLNFEETYFHILIWILNTKLKENLSNYQLAIHLVTDTSGTKNIFHNIPKTCSENILKLIPRVYFTILLIDCQVSARLDNIMLLYSLEDNSNLFHSLLNFIQFWRNKYKSRWVELVEGQTRRPF